MSWIISTPHISPTPVLKKSLLSMHRLIETGFNRASFEPSSLPLEPASITVTTSKKPLVSHLDPLTPSRQSVTSTLESPRITNLLISNNKLTPSHPPTPITSSCQMSHQDLTGNAEACKPFWTPFTTTVSDRLWSCTRTDSVVSGGNGSSGSVAKLAHNSWFTVRSATPIPALQKNLQKTSCLSSMSSLQEIMDYAPLKTAKEEVPAQKTKKPLKEYKARKIRLLPSSTQRRILNTWFDAVRFIYNNCVELAQRRTGNKLTKKLLRHHFVNNRTVKEKWLLQVPYEVRDGAIADFQQARKAAFTLLQEGHIESFNMKFRRRKSPSQSLHLRSRGWHGDRAQPFPTFWDGQSLKATEPIPYNLLADSTIQKTWDGRYYLCLPEPIAPRDESQVSGVVSLDPGVRTFQTTFSPEEGGLVTEWGAGDVTRIGRLCWSLDRLTSKMWSGGCGSRRRAVYRKAAVRIRRKIKSLVKDLHCKLAKWLCSKYKMILLPTFETSQMVKTGTRKIHSKTARMMLGWSHFQFKQRLIAKSRETGSKVVIVGEEYTSKTCGGCGEVNQQLGGSKTFRCRRDGCGYETYRDWNGARNILLKWVTEVQNGLVE